MPSNPIETIPPNLRSFLTITEIDDAEFVVGALFRRKFASPPPDFGRHLVAFYRMPDQSLRLAGFSLGLAYPASVDTVAKVPGVFTDLRFPAALADKEDMRQLLGFAREAHLRTCAEGVERVAQWETLENLGCKAASGPLIAPAMHLDQAEEWALLRMRQLG